MITIIGLGPGDGRYILPAALDEIRRCDILSGFTRRLRRFSRGGGKNIDLSSSAGMGLGKGLAEIDRLRHGHRIGILVSGDPGFYSLLETVNRIYPGWEPAVIPGLSAFQVACAKIGLPWQDLELISLHNEPSAQVNRFPESPDQGAIILTGGDCTPGNAASHLISLVPSLANRRTFLCSDIGEEEERIRKTILRDIASLPPGRLSVIILPPENSKTEEMEQ